MTISTVGFIGLGKMGSPMAARLARAGLSMLVFDQSAEATARLVAEPGVEAVESVADWAQADALVLMLPNSAIVESALLDSGVADTLAPGTLVIDMSSSEPMRTRALAETLKAKGLRFIDAPVSGGVAGAENGALAVMVGGDPGDLKEADVVFEPLAKRVYPVGPVGSGHAAKALNNLVSATTLAITVEALKIGERFGISPEILTGVLNGSSGRSNTSENKVLQFMLSGTYASGFSLQLMAKDVGIAVALADQLGDDARLAACASEIWKGAAEEVTPQTDHTEMYRLID